MLAISMLTTLASCGESGKTVESGESGESVRVNAIDNQYVATVNSLTATDALGRSFNEALVSDSNNKVGLFYWIWHGEHTSAGIFNISELLENDPDILWSTGVACKEKSPINATHYWAEPLYGYYSSDDPSMVLISKYLPDADQSGITALWEIMENSYKTTYTNYEFVSKEATTMGGQNAEAYTFTATIGTVNYKVKQIISGHGNYFYSMTYMSSPENFDSHLEALTGMAGVFEFK